MFTVALPPRFPRPLCSSAVTGGSGSNGWRLVPPLAAIAATDLTNVLSHDSC